MVVNFVELLCTAGLPAITTAVLAQHDLSPATYYAYLGLYILGYVADDSIMVAIAVVALGNRKLTEAAGRRLELRAGLSWWRWASCCCRARSGRCTPRARGSVLRGACCG